MSDYNPTSMDATLARIETKLDSLATNQANYQTIDNAWKKAHQEIDTKEFSSIREELVKVNASRWTFIGIVIAISTLGPWLISLLKK